MAVGSFTVADTTAPRIVTAVRKCMSCASLNEVNGKYLRVVLVFFFPQSYVYRQSMFFDLKWSFLHAFPCQIF